MADNGVFRSVDRVLFIDAGCATLPTWRTMSISVETGATCPLIPPSVYAASRWTINSSSRIRENSLSPLQFGWFVSRDRASCMCNDSREVPRTALARPFVATNCTVVYVRQTETAFDTTTVVGQFRLTELLIKWLFYEVKENE